jgi:hypothetical protein
MGWMSAYRSRCCAGLLSIFLVAQGKPLRAEELSAKARAATPMQTESAVKLNR